MGRTCRVLVYTFIDPDTGKPRYVGSTFHSLQERYQEHIAGSYKRRRPIEVWLSDLIAQDRYPTMAQLEATSDNDRACERRWIACFEQMYGDLLNRKQGGNLKGYKFKKHGELPIVYTWNPDAAATVPLGTQNTISFTHSPNTAPG